MKILIKNVGTDKKIKFPKKRVNIFFFGKILFHNLGNFLLAVNLLSLKVMFYVTFRKSLKHFTKSGIETFALELKGWDAKSINAKSTNLTANNSNKTE